MEPVKIIVANNLCELRKSKGLTQQQLADIFCYSDKSISKWEHGETLPDIETLKLLCDYYGVTLDYLVSDKAKQEVMKTHDIEDQTIKTSKSIIVALAISVVWIAAAIIFFGVFMTSKLMFGKGRIVWMSFVWAIPLSILLGIIFNAKWAEKKWNSWLVVSFLWTTLASFYIQIGISLPADLGWTLWMIFLVGVPLTIAAFLFGNLKNRPKNRD